MSANQGQRSNNRSSKKKRKKGRIAMITEIQNLPRTKGYKFSN